jgi:hypothetical protein
MRRDSKGRFVRKVVNGIPGPKIDPVRAATNFSIAGWNSLSDNARAFWANKQQQVMSDFNTRPLSTLGADIDHDN